MNEKELSIDRLLIDCLLELDFLEFATLELRESAFANLDFLMALLLELTEPVFIEFFEDMFELVLLFLRVLFFVNDFF